MDTKPEFSDADFERPKSCPSPPMSCVEVAEKDGFVAIRDSEGDGALVFTESEWRVFIQGVKDGQFDV